MVVEAAGNPDASRPFSREARQLTAEQARFATSSIHISTRIIQVDCERSSRPGPDLTHELNVPFYEKMLRNPARSRRIGWQGSRAPPVLEGVGDRKVMTDGTRTVEVLHMRGNLHSEGMLMVYLPKERMLVQADQFSPRPAGIELPLEPLTRPTSMRTSSG